MRLRVLAFISLEERALFNLHSLHSFDREYIYAHSVISEALVYLTLIRLAGYRSLSLSANHTSVLYFRVLSLYINIPEATIHRNFAVDTVLYFLQWLETTSFSPESSCFCN